MVMYKLRELKMEMLKSSMVTSMGKVNNSKSEAQV